MTNEEQQKQAEILRLRTDDRYDYFEFPKAMYRDKPKGYERSETPGWVPPVPFETRVVDSAEEQEAAEAEGYRLTPFVEKKA